MDIESRIAVLEKDVQAINSELAVIRYDRVGAEELSDRLRQVEGDLVTIKYGTAHLQSSVSRLTEQVRQVGEGVASIRIELMRVSTLQSLSAPKADWLKVHGMMAAVGQRLEWWMVVAALAATASIFGMIVRFSFG